MQNILDQAPPVQKRNYDFVDTIRCIAMIFIVMEHSTYFEPGIYQPVGEVRNFLYFFTIQISKFGTICFFLLAGFLIGDKFTDYTPLQYLKRRVGSTIKPWLFWSLMFIFIVNFYFIVDKVLGRQTEPGFDFWKIISDSFKTTYLYTIYWFIPNFLFCITVLLIFKKYLYSWVFGGILAVFTLFYAVNIYFSWIYPGHTTAIFGFVFFLWLGAQLHKNWEKVNVWISKTSVYMWWVLSAITLLFGIAEINFLRSLHNEDPYNSLRVSNIAFSMCCFFLLLKIRNFKLISYLKPRETTFGVYLVHYIFVVSVLPKIFHDFHINVNNLALPVLIGYQFLRFLVVYSLVMISVQLLNKTKLKWLIGR